MQWLAQAIELHIQEPKFSNFDFSSKINRKADSTLHDYSSRAFQLQAPYLVIYTSQFCHLHPFVYPMSHVYYPCRVP